MNEEFKILLEKLTRFKRKYYLNKLLRGLILSSTFIIILFIVIDIYEYYLWSNVTVRTTIFYLFLVAIISVLSLQVLHPIFKLFKLGQIISHEEAAKIIGNYFPEISDKLLNTLQLQNEINTNQNTSLSLLIASIEQKTKELKPISFRKAITYKSNYKYLKWLGIPLSVILFALIISPAFITEPASRLVNHKIKYEKPLPYNFKIVNDSLVGIQGEDFTVLVEIVGDEIPGTAYLNDGKYDFRLLKNTEGLYEYTFSKLRNDIYFQVVSEEVTSNKYKIVVLPKPNISNFNIVLEFPSYLKKKNETIESTGDIVVPEGTKINWRFYTSNTSKLVFVDDNKNVMSSNDSDNVFSVSKIAKVDFKYFVYSQSKNFLNSDTLSYSVIVVNDEKPNIVIEHLDEEYLLGYIMTSGTISDDYGFSSLKFFYKQKDDSIWQNNEIAIDNNIEKQNFNHSFNTKDVGLNLGKELEFYYEIWDNDRVNGYKYTRTNILSFKIPEKDEIEKTADSTSDLMKSKYEKSITDLDKISKELEQLKMSMFEKKDVDWSDRKKLKDLVEKEKQIRESLSEMKELNSKRDALKDFLQDNPDETIKEKLDKLTEQLDKLKDDEMLEKLKELTKNIDELTKDQLDKLLDDLKNNQEQFKDNLEQQLEYFKQLEIQQKLNETTDKIKELAKKQDNLKEKTSDKENKLEDALKEQDKLNDEFDKIKEQLKDIDSLNSDLKKPLELDSKKELQKDVDAEMKKSSENLNSGKRKKAEETQTSAVNKLNELSQKLDMMMEKAMQSRTGEDAEKIGNILDNLLDISFNLEDLMGEIAKTSNNDPKFTDNSMNLKLLKDDYSILHDSLIAISKRQMFIQQFLVKESNNIEMYLNRSLATVQERQIPQTTSNIQYAMTSANNLALMLEESLNKMKQSMNMPGSKSGDADCDTPGAGSSQGMQQMMKMQQGIGQGLKKAGQQQGKGENSGQGSKGESQEMARLAAEQSELRKQMQQLLDKLEGEGGNGSSLQKIIEKMESQEKDIVNKRITSETIERQKEIETRLLQADKALMEREKEERRESVEGKNKKNGNNKANLKYNDNTVNDFNSVIYMRPIILSSPYKRMLKKYLYDIENEK